MPSGGKTGSGTLDDVVVTGWVEEVRGGSVTAAVAANSVEVAVVVVLSVPQLTTRQAKARSRIPIVTPETKLRFNIDTALFIKISGQIMLKVNYTYCCNTFINENRYCAILLVV